jgi:predicted mannosyl-3-phosphoglycerate phosphatase (HAD superfamily)
MTQILKALIERRLQKEQLMSYIIYIENISKDVEANKKARHDLIKQELINDLKEIDDEIKKLNEGCKEGRAKPSE